jgi:hypothetical protein
LCPAAASVASARALQLSVWALAVWALALIRRS